MSRNQWGRKAPKDWAKRQRIYPNGKEIDSQTISTQVGRIALGFLSSGVDKLAEGFKPAKNTDQLLLRGRKVVLAMSQQQPDPKSPVVDWVYDDDQTVIKMEEAS